MIMHQLYINYTHNIWHSLALSWCWKTQSVPRPELILDRNLSCFCVFSYVFLVFVVKRGFNEEPELARKVASFWKHWAALEGAPGKRCRAGDLSLISFPPGERTGTPTAAWSHQQGELGLGAIGATGDGLHLSTYLSTFVYCEYYICPLWNSPFFAYFIHVASFTWWNQTEIPSDHFFA